MQGALVKLSDYLLSSLGIAVSIIEVTEALPLLTKQADNAAQ